MTRVLTAIQILLLTGAIVLVWIALLPLFDGGGDVLDENGRLILGAAASLAVPALLIAATRWALHHWRRTRLTTDAAGTSSHLR